LIGAVLSPAEIAQRLSPRRRTVALMIGAALVVILARAATAR